MERNNIMKKNFTGGVFEKVESLLNEKQAAEFLSVAPGTLAVWRSTGRYNLPFVKVGKAVRYRREALENWLENRTQAQNNCATE